MPWRGETDPYKIWISEIMLQQTQVATVRDYYLRWIKRFPDIQSVSESSIDEVLKYWEGLGYYSRARNFYQSCRALNKQGSKVPKGMDEFRKLKGVGPYIAAAVQSIAFNIPVGVVDGNVNRVISRFYAYKDIPLKNKKKINEFMSLIINQKRPGDINQAMMDLGRYVCKPSNPLCDQCPLNKGCKALQLGIQSDLPITIKKAQKPHYDVAVGIIWDKNKLLITKRKEDGLLGGLWEFPGGKIKKNESIKSAIKREIKEELSINIKPETLIHQVDHHYSHFSVTINAINCQYNGGQIKLSGPTDFKWVNTSKLRSYAFPKASIKLFNAIENLE
jgi:A/G-specific adenine glycosylase